MLVLKCLRVRLMVFIFSLTLIWIGFYYFFKSTTKEIPHTSAMLLKRDIPALDIAVYYECLCSDSRSFFVNELLPVVEKIPHLLKIDFVPYGKAQTIVNSNDSPKYQFKCQHGPQECLGNKIHACTITELSDVLTETKVLTCMIAGKANPEESGRKCAEEFNLKWSKIWQCAEGREGEELLKLNGDKTHALVPKVTFIPTVLLDNELGNQAAILKDLWKEVCLKFEQMGYRPKECE